MKVGVIGSGVVGQTLAAGFLKHGHEVAIGTRDPAKLKDWQAKNKSASVKSLFFLYSPLSTFSTGGGRRRNLGRGERKKRVGSMSQF